MNRERAAQIAEKEAIKYEGMKRDAEIAKLMKSEHERAENAESNRELERWQESVRYQQVNFFSAEFLMDNFDNAECMKTGVRETTRRKGEKEARGIRGILERKTNDR